jgi:IS30 family transposase
VERLSDREKEEIARLSALGLPSRLIGAQIGRHHRTVLGCIARLRHPPVVEPARSALRLSLDEREVISRGLAGGESLRVIGQRLGRASSTISREVAANGGRRRYRACRADKAALPRMRRPKRSKLVLCPRLRDVVEAKLELRWSPQQISGWLVEQFPDDPEMRVSHETIYLSLFVQSRGALRPMGRAVPRCVARVPRALGRHRHPGHSHRRDGSTVRRLGTLEPDGRGAHGHLHDVSQLRATLQPHWTAREQPPSCLECRRPPDRRPTRRATLRRDDSAPGFDAARRRHAMGGTTPVACVVS